MKPFYWTVHEVHSSSQPTRTNVTISNLQSIMSVRLNIKSKKCITVEPRALFVRSKSNTVISYRSIFIAVFECSLTLIRYCPKHTSLRPRELSWTKGEEKYSPIQHCEERKHVTNVWSTPFEWMFLLVNSKFGSPLINLMLVRKMNRLLRRLCRINRGKSYCPRTAR